MAYVVAAGNSNVDMKDFVPAAYDEVLSVTAVADFNGRPGGAAATTCRADGDDTADFSNWTTVGHRDADHTIAAPGVCITPTWKDGGYNTISGRAWPRPMSPAPPRAALPRGPLRHDVAGELMASCAPPTRRRSPLYGFAEDPHRVTSAGSRYYGYLEYAGGY